MACSSTCARRPALVMQEATGKSVLNMFAYTCGIGIAAAKAGARHVVNVDFAESALAVGKRRARASTSCRSGCASSNAMPSRRCASSRHRPAAVRARQAHAALPELKAQQFDVVFLDPRATPAALRRGRPGQGLPCVVLPALLATAEGGIADLLQQRCTDGPRSLVDQLSAAPERPAGRFARWKSSPRKPTSPVPTTSRR